MKHLTNECPAEKGTLRIMNVRFLRQALLASFSVSWVLPVLYSGIANATAIDFQPGSQPAGPTSGADTGQDWVLILVLAALACGIVAIVLWELWGYFSAASGGRSPPGSLSPVIEAVSPPYPVHLRASRLKDSSLPIIEGVSPASPNVTAPRSETTPVHAYFILQNDQPEGPYSIEELRSLWNSGVLAGETFYCEEGYDEWLRLEKIADQLEPPPTGAAATNASNSECCTYSGSTKSRGAVSAVHPS